MQKWSFSNEQKRRFQQLLDKQGEVTRRDEKLSSKEYAEMIRLSVLAARDIERTEMSQDQADSFLGTYAGKSQEGRSVKSPPEMKDNNTPILFIKTQAESAQEPSGHMEKQVGSYTEESERLLTKRPTIGGVLNIITGVIFLVSSASPGGWLLAPVGVVTIVGGIFAIKRRFWGFALVGAICSSVLLLGLPAIILIALSKAEFTGTPQGTARASATPQQVVRPPQPERKASGIVRELQTLKIEFSKIPAQ